MPGKIMTMLASVTGGKSYRAHKYGLDHAERPFILHVLSKQIVNSSEYTKNLKLYDSFNHPSNSPKEMSPLSHRAFFSRAFSLQA